MHGNSNIKFSKKILRNSPFIAWLRRILTLVIRSICQGLFVLRTILQNIKLFHYRSGQALRTPGG